MAVHCSSNKGVIYASGPTVYVASSSSPTPKALSKIDPFSSAKANAGHIKINNSSNLIAVSAGDQVQIWSLDPSIWTSEIKLPPRKVSEVSFESDIKSLIWQPCSRFDATLIVLTEHRVTSIFCAPGEVPIIERIAVTDSDNLPIDSAGVSLGSPDSPSGFATSYLGSEDGDIYQLCPFTPPEIELLPGQAKDLKLLAPSKEWQAEFDSWSDVRQAKVRVLKRNSDSVSRRSLSLVTSIKLASLKLKPYPEELYEDDCIDLSAGSIDWGADFIVQTMTRYVNFYVASSVAAGNHSTLIASVKFKDAKQVRKVELIDPSCVVINVEGDDGSKRTHVVDVGQFNQLDERTGDAKGPTGPIHIQNLEYGLPYSSRHELILLPPDFNRTNIREIPVSQTDASSSDVANAVKNLSINESKLGSYSDPQAIQNSLQKLQSQIESNPDVPPAVSLEPNAKALWSFAKLSQHYQSQIALLFKLVMSIVSERQARERDITLQNSACHDLITLLEKHNTDTQVKSTQKDRLTEALERNENFKERLAAIKDRVDAQVLSSSNLAPSQAERSWFTELEEGLPEKLNKHLEQIEHLKQQMKQSQVPAASEHQGHSPTGNPAKIREQIKEIQSRSRKQDGTIAAIMADLA